MGFPDGSVVKNLPANVGDVGSIPGSESFPEGGNGYLLYILAWEVPRRGAWWDTVQGVTKELDMSEHTYIHG